MEEASSIAVCLHMMDGQRLITTFQSSKDATFYESLMIEVLNRCETFVMIKSYRNEFELDEFDDLVINKNNIVSIKTIS